jgi:periodic tryptophan protein 2
VRAHTDSDEELLPPGGDPAAAADVPGTSTRKRPSAQTRALALSPTGASWAAATTEGLLLYALDSGMTFDPTDLTEALTPAAFHQVRLGLKPAVCWVIGWAPWGLAIADTS